jgi:hypothetical protein
MVGITQERTPIWLLAHFAEPSCQFRKTVVKSCCRLVQVTKLQTSLPVRHKDPKEVAPLVDLLVDSNLLKTFDIYECLTKTCDECTGSYSGIGIKVRCRCSCHNGDDKGRVYESLIFDPVTKKQYELNAGHTYTGANLKKLMKMSKTRKNK